MADCPCSQSLCNYIYTDFTPTQYIYIYIYKKYRWRWFQADAFTVVDFTQIHCYCSQSAAPFAGGHRALHCRIVPSRPLSGHPAQRAADARHRSPRRRPSGCALWRGDSGHGGVGGSSSPKRRSCHARGRNSHGLLTGSIAVPLSREGRR